MPDDYRKPWLIGEAPARIMDGRIVPAFSSRSGQRLSELVDEDVTEAFHTHNLLERWPGSAGKGSRFPIEHARNAASKWALHRRRDIEGNLVILVGGRVAEAFRCLPATPILTWLPFKNPNVRIVIPRVSARFCIIPHPSGVNRWWNVPGNGEKVERALKEALEWARRRS